MRGMKHGRQAVHKGRSRVGGRVGCFVCLLEGELKPSGGHEDSRSLEKVLQEWRMVNDECGLTRASLPMLGIVLYFEVI